MRKALVGLILAATMATPVAAQVSDAKRQRMMQHYQELEQRNQARSAQRQQREVRQERRENRVERRAERQAGFDRAERRENRIERREDRRDRRADRRRDIEVAPNGVVVRRLPNGDVRYTTREDYREERREARRDRRDWRQERRDRRRWDRAWRNDRRYDWQRYRYGNRNIFNRGRYYAPYRNHSYSRFSIGLTLGSPFYSNRYWISDPWQYRLPPAYAGTQWVRYYDDVLLVDVYTGEVLDVIYDFFW